VSIPWYAAQSVLRHLLRMISRSLCVVSRCVQQRSKQNLSESSTHSSYRARRRPLISSCTSAVSTIRQYLPHVYGNLLESDFPLHSAGCASGPREQSRLFVPSLYLLEVEEPNAGNQRTATSITIWGRPRQSREGHIKSMGGTLQVLSCTHSGHDRCQTTSP
jgi:hypothetical protein